MVGKLLKYPLFNGSFAQFWVVWAKLWLFEGWLSFRSWFQDNNLLLHIVRQALIRSFWLDFFWYKDIKIVHHLVVILLYFELVRQRYDSNGWCTNYALVISLWSGNINGLMIPSSSPHRFHKKICIFVKTFERMFI